MDLIFSELIGKPNLNPPKIITVVAENFSLLEDKSKFLRATLAIPSVKKLPSSLAKRLVQFGNLARDVEVEIREQNWAMNKYEDIDDSICNRLEDDLSDVGTRSLICFNDISRLRLSTLDTNEHKKFMRLALKLKYNHGHFILIIYQNSSSQRQDKLLRDLKYISDGFISAKLCESCYFLSTWYQKTPDSKSLVPPRVETSYFCCKIGKFYWESNLLCFYERKKVVKNYDPDDKSQIDNDDDYDHKVKLLETKKILAGDNDDDEDGDGDFLHKNSLPFLKAQDPENSRIFYYPDKDDDIDDDDPDNDLEI